MLEPNKHNPRSQDRFQRRKASKSPINIRGKIKELEEKLEKNHKLKEAPKVPIPPTAHHSPQKDRNNHPNRVKSSRQVETPSSQKIIPRIESHKLQSNFVVIQKRWTVTGGQSRVEERIRKCAVPRGCHPLLPRSYGGTLRVARGGRGKS